ncbi:MAG: ATP-dependent DNA helicase RecG [Bacteroidota bacterium]
MIAVPFLSTPIEFLKGVGPDRAKILKSEINIHTFGDLLTYYPFRYIDRTKFYKIKEVKEELPFVQLRGKLSNVEITKGKSKRLVAEFEDDTGTIILVWFQGIKWIIPHLKADVEYIVFGKPTMFQGNYNIAHPEIEPVSEENTVLASKMQPVYSTTKKLESRWLDSKGLWKLQRILNGMIKGKIPETLSAEIIKKHNFPSYEEALLNIHLPLNPEMLNRAQYRLKFDELFFMQLRLLQTKLIRKKTYSGFVFSSVGKCFNDFYNNHLPFELTNAQKRVIKEIRNDMNTGKQMNRLLQGDVGSGKTIVALMSMLLAIDNGYQACIMAPTEILAMQHFDSISQLLGNMSIKISLLTGSTKKSERKIIHEALQNGELNILIGTHALLEEEVQFKNLGLAVIDEQHRFGVAQRANLWKKSPTHQQNSGEKSISIPKGLGWIPPHVFVMTATPIPRTLAMTLYGDLDISVIDEMPPGRKHIKTVHCFEPSRHKIFNFMKEQIKKGRQIYVVYPIIKESEKLDYKNLSDGFEIIRKEFPLPEYNVGIAHGQLKNNERDLAMKLFVQSKTHILVATTVIEVGVDIPNASVMVIESAERFGLSQLHQLRGRVGRGAEESFCILMTDYKLSADARTRIETIVRTNNGFEIAEVDMQLRGFGDMAGTQQSGILDFHIADISKDAQLLHYTHSIAEELLRTDAQLTKPENFPILSELNKIKKAKPYWGRIS